jgi:hypothetical protein
MKDKVYEVVRAYLNLLDENSDGTISSDEIQVCSHYSGSF